MRAQTYRPRIQNGTVAKRRNRTVVTKIAGRRSSSRRSSSRRQKKERQREPNVLLILMLIGAFVAAGFVLALRSQINSRHLGQAEAQLRGELDEIANRQRYEILEQQRALSPRESDRAARQAGLIQPRFNRPETKIEQPASRPQPVQMSRAKKESNNQRQSMRLALRR